MWRSIASNAITFLIVALFLVGGVILWGRGQYEAPGPLAQAICVQVERGTNFRRVSRALEQQGAVSSVSIFRVGADYAGKTDQLKAGSYIVEAGASMQNIVDVVTRGGASTCGTEVVYRIGVNRLVAQVRKVDPTQKQFVEIAEFQPGVEDAPANYTDVRASQDTRYRIALAEGVTSWQVVTALRSMDVLQGVVDKVPPEGSLAPDSYEVRPGDQLADVLSRMAEKQDLLIAAAWETRKTDIPLDTPEELLILASIIEKETGVADERRQVASVFVNRLNRGMPLQTDPTVIYGITRGQGALGRGLRRSELRAATPWNTYVIEGLPPTPIANPGRASLMAAAQPDETDYVFFVADGTGGHAFSKTLDAHNRNVAQWRKIEAERAKDN